MKCSWNCIDLGWRLGMLGDMMMEAISIAELLETKVSFEFNGVQVTVNKNTSVLYDQGLVQNAVAHSNKRLNVCR